MYFSLDVNKKVRKQLFADQFYKTTAKSTNNK